MLVSTRGLSMAVSLAAAVSLFGLLWAWGDVITTISIQHAKGTRVYVVSLQGVRGAHATNNARMAFHLEQVRSESLPAPARRAGPEGLELLGWSASILGS